MNPARLLIPALRADPDGTFRAAEASAWSALDRGVGGFILFGGAAQEVAGLTAALRARAPHPLLIGSDLERGAGQQFSGATSLPPAAALASLHDLVATRRAGYVTGAEAVALGMDWAFAPVADLDVEPQNPIVGTRAFGADPEEVARQVAAWVEGCAEAGALACAKHFPGHGRTVEDSHLSVARATADEATLRRDMLPFMAAIEAGVPSIMTAHVAYPALDPAGTIATLSPRILEGILREELGFDGLVVSDALRMAGVSGASGEGPAAVAALQAGCDLLLYPEQPGEVAASLDEAVAAGLLTDELLARSLRRLDAALQRRPEFPFPPAALGRDGDWAATTAMRTIFALRGDPRPVPPMRLIVIDDDLGGPHLTPSRKIFRAALEPFLTTETGLTGPPVVGLFSDPRAWKGRAGLSESSRAQVAEICTQEPAARIILFAHPRLVEQIPAARHVACAWGGEPIMQRAAADWLIARQGPPR